MVAKNRNVAGTGALTFRESQSSLGVNDGDVALESRKKDEQLVKDYCTRIYLSLCGLFGCGLFGCFSDENDQASDDSVNELIAEGSIEVLQRVKRGEQEAWAVMQVASYISIQLHKEVVSA